MILNGRTAAQAKQPHPAAALIARLSARSVAQPEAPYHVPSTLLEVDGALPPAARHPACGTAGSASCGTGRKPCPSGTSRRGTASQEITVYADGFDETTAGRIDSLETFGCTRQDQGKREGRYHLAAGRLRPETYELSCDVENLLVTRGDLVRVSHDVPLWGSGWGRIRSVATDDEGRVTGFVLDEPVPIRGDRTYAVRIRRADASSPVASIAAEPGNATEFALSVPIPPADGFATGDLAMVGEAERESAALIVKACTKLSTS